MAKEKVRRNESLTIRVDAELKAEIDELAEKDARTPSNLGMLLLQRGLEVWKQERAA